MANLYPHFILVIVAWIFHVSGSRWDRSNNPNNWWYAPVKTLSSLPSSGRTARATWSDTYWPNNKGGIASRWQTGQSFGYRLLQLSELRRMGPSGLRTLSPAEKFDIYNNRLDYPTVKSEWRRTSPSNPNWFGLCHGWAPASKLFREPGPVTLTASNGIRVPFGSSDVKALLTYLLAVVWKRVDIVGTMLAMQALRNAPLPFLVSFLRILCKNARSREIGVVVCKCLLRVLSREFGHIDDHSIHSIQRRRYGRLASDATIPFAEMI